MSWNIRMFKGSKARLEDADELISAFSPDVLGILEFKAKKQARELMFKRFPEYDFAITDSTGNLEVIMGYKRGKFKQVITTQRRKFNNKPRTLRPGALISVNHKNEWFNLLFLHTKSGDSRTEFNLRQAAFKNIWSLEKTLKSVSPSRKSNLIALGDLNTMGRGALFDGEKEIEKLHRDSLRNNMDMLTKDSEFTWHDWGKNKRKKSIRKLKVSELDDALKSDLDHVLASKNLNFVAHGDDGSSAIHVEGWQQLEGVNRTNFLFSLSDHSALFGEVF